MRSTLALFSLLIVVGCNSGAEVTSGSSSSKAANAEAPYIWGNKTFPKTMQISSSFNAVAPTATGTNGLSEVTAIKAMATSWKTAVGGVDFIAFGAGTNNNYDLSDPDSVLGVYKSTTWPSDISTEALAITQLFGRRYNTGDSDEYVSIVHADIIVNYDDWTFHTEDSGSGYDLRSVVLHEMGHFLGLQHIPSFDYRDDEYSSLSRTDYKAISVMYPSVSTSEIPKRIPKQLDINTMAYKYNIGGTTGSGAIAASNAARYVPKNDDPGKNTKIILELRRNGDCIHKEDGVEIRRHHIDL